MRKRNILNESKKRNVLSNYSNKQLRELSNTWIDISRGFVASDDGDKIIHIADSDIKGYWVYGYMVQLNDETVYIYGGPQIGDIQNPTQQYSVIPSTTSRCTGGFAVGDYGLKPIFQFDVVNCLYKGKVYENLTVYWHAPTCSWGMANMDKPDGTYMFDRESEITVLRTIFDKT